MTDNQKSTKEREGWSYNMCNRAKTHYYKDGISLCNRIKDTTHLGLFEKREGSIYFCDCAICVKKETEL